MKVDNSISAETRAQIRFAEGHLVKTMDKASFVKRLKEIRYHSVDPVEADLAHALIKEVDSGCHDG